jgi:hypothetical protein
VCHIGSCLLLVGLLVAPRAAVVDMSLCLPPGSPLVRASRQAARVHLLWLPRLGRGTLLRLHQVLCLPVELVYNTSSAIPV